LIPTIVVGGYLGAGKTTLINHLLRHAGGRRIAVLVNDFGEVGIDADLIESRDGAVLNLAGGCICCSVGSDLIGALVEIPKRSPAPDVVLIETSGVALPGSVARGARLAEGIDVEGVAVLVDAETVRERAEDRYVGDTVLRQLLEADLLVVNKVDLIDAAHLADLRGWLAERAPSARQVETVASEVPAEVILGLRLEGSAAGDGPSLSFGTRLAPPARGAADVFASLTFDLARPVDARALAAALAGPDTGVVRAKGLLDDIDGSKVVLQVVGRRWTVAPATGPAPSGRLVCLGLRGQLDQTPLARLVGVPPRS
jgi:G3E family GTPase